jgi:5-methylcytosine-specific restriction endonuclease McrA
MPWDWDTLNWVYDRTDGYCRYCGKKIYWRNYGKPDQRGPWEVDHSVPLALGGTDYLRNLWPACTDCNRDKGTMPGSQYRRLMNDVPNSSSSGGSVVGDLVALFLFVLFLKAFQK